MPHETMNPQAKSILWLDGGAAFTAGLVVLALRGWLSALHGFAPALVVFLGVANLVYGTYSGSLAVRASRGRRPSRRAIDFLVFANLAWVVVSATVLVVNRRSVSGFGIAHVAFEGLFVGTLAFAELRFVRPFAR